MGAQLVSRVYTSWSHLPDRPFRLLCHMALIVKDATKKPTYWGGRDAMAQALGLEPGEAAYQSVKRAVRQIVAAGAAEIAIHGHAGKRTEYVLTLTGKGVTERPSRGSVNDPHSGSVNDPQRGSLSDPSAGHSVTPQGTTEGGTEENREEPHLVTNSGVVRATPRITKSRNSNLDSVRERMDAEAAS